MALTTGLAADLEAMWVPPGPGAGSADPAPGAPSPERRPCAAHDRVRFGQNRGGPTLAATTLFPWAVCKDRRIVPPTTGRHDHRSPSAGPSFRAFGLHPRAWAHPGPIDSRLPRLRRRSDRRGRRRGRGEQRDAVRPRFVACRLPGPRGRGIAGRPGSRAPGPPCASAHSGTSAGAARAVESRQPRRCGRGARRCVTSW